MSVTAGGGRANPLLRLFGPRLLVLGVTLLLLAMALASVGRWGYNIGLAEDWFVVPAMTGHRLE